jgi:hypothetical protein
MTVVQDIVLPFGEDRNFFVTLVQEDELEIEQPIDLTAGGTKLWLTVKRALADDDVDAVLHLDSDTAGEITLNSPVTVGKNRAKIEVNAAAWPADYPGPTLVYDIQLKHQGEVTTPFRGLVRCPRGVTKAIA